MLRDGVAVNALAFLSEPLYERRAIGDLAPRLSQRFALLRRQDAGQIFLMFHHQFKPTSQDGGPLLCGARGPSFLCALGRRYGATGFRRAHYRNGT